MSASRAVRKSTGRLDAARPERLADVAAVRVGQPDVDDEASGGARSTLASSSVPVAKARDLEVFFREAPDEHAAQLGVVLDDQDLRGIGKSSPAALTAHAASLRAAAAASRARRAPSRPARPSTAAPASPARKPQGTASASGGGSNTCWSIATSISEAATRARLRARCRAEHERRLAPEEGPDLAQGAPSAAIVANSCRRSAIASATNSAIAPAASTIANASSMWLIPRRSTVVIELTVWAVCCADVLDLRAVGPGRGGDSLRDGGRVAARLREHDVRALCVGRLLEVARGS